MAPQPHGLWKLSRKRPQALSDGGQGTGALRALGDALNEELCVHSPEFRGKFVEAATPEPARTQSERHGWRGSADGPHPGSRQSTEKRTGGSLQGEFLRNVMDLTVLRKWPRLDKRLMLYGMLIAIFVAPLKAATAARLKCSHEESRAVEVPQVLAIQARVILGDDVDNAVYPFIVRIEVTFGGRSTSTENEVGSNFIGDTLQDACPDIQPSGNKRNPSDPNTPGRMCVGSVISPKHVLTAGRCLWPV
ncbi:hypothetical protein ISCGN_018107 [Ixodes scapularis]